eukprot:c8105_g1_i1.p1 GENE.c8105_g1_i1~~c8105_g1_i1.p1  ORF type:complete len:493 (-),score=95.95 c8105_g1_i1:1152-2501(-)
MKVEGSTENSDQTTSTQASENLTQASESSRPEPAADTTTGPDATAAAPTSASASKSNAPAVDRKDSAMASLTPAVRARVEAMFNSGKCGRDELETCCIDSLRDFPEDMALQIVDKFLETDIATVRSKTAFFIGILKRYRTNKSQPSMDPNSFPVMYAPSQQMGLSVGMLPFGYTDPDKERALSTLPYQVRYKLECLFATGRVLREELETCCIDSLRDFDEYAACEIVDKFGEADFGRIKSKTAFFIGILKRYRVNVPSRKGQSYAGGSHPSMATSASPVHAEKLTQSMSTLLPNVRDKMEAVFNSGVVRKDEIEACCMDSLRDFPEALACQIIDKFAEADMNTVRNKTAFFIGVLKRYRATTGLTSRSGSVSAPSSASAPSWSAVQPSYSLAPQIQQYSMQGQMGMAAPPPPAMMSGYALPPQQQPQQQPQYMQQPMQQPQYMMHHQWM